MGWPLLGETLDFLNTARSLEFYTSRRGQHGDVFKSHVLFSPTAFVYGEDNIRALLAQEHKLVESNWPVSIQKLLGPGSLVTQTFGKHTQQRRIVGQAFTREAIDSYTPTVIEVARKHVGDWVAAGDVKGYLAAKDITLDVAGAALVGWRFSPSELGEFRDMFMQYVRGFFGLPFDLPWTNLGRGLQARRWLLDRIGGFVADAIEARAQGKRQAEGTPANTLDVLLAATDENGKAATMDEIKDQVLTQLFAGHETTATAATVALAELCRHPEVLQRLRAEQASIVAEFGDEMTPQALEKMRYTDAVVKEVVRYRPPVPLVWRKALQDLEVGGKRIPQGWQVMLLIGRTTREIAQWQESADVFDPDRWFEAAPASNGASAGAPIKTPPGYLAFGDGARVCVGMRLALLELKAMIALLARHAEWGPREGSDSALSFFGPPADGLPLVFKELPRAELMKYADAAWVPATQQLRSSCPLVFKELQMWQYHDAKPCSHVYQYRRCSPWGQSRPCCYLHLPRPDLAQCADAAVGARLAVVQ